jgi:exosortase/archaeosortase family protein
MQTAAPVVTTIPRAIGPRLVALLGLGYLAFLLLVDPIRRFEAAVAASTLRSAVSMQVLNLGNGSLAVGGKETLVTVLTRACSSTAGLVGLAVLAVALRRSSPGRRFAAFCAAAALVFITNVLRIVLVIAVGHSLGRGGLVLTHDWTGPILTLGGAGLGVLVMFRMAIDRSATPKRSVANLLSAARTADRTNDRVAARTPVSVGVSASPPGGVDLRTDDIDDDWDWE